MKERIKENLRALGIKPSKSLGQSFLIEPGAIQSIIEFGKPQKNHGIIVEIGAGTGILTRELAEYCKTYAIEVETALCGALNKLNVNIEVINEDARFVDLSQFGNKLLIFGNIPYSFSTDLVFSLIKQYRVIDRAVLLLQKEFAQRLASPPGSKTYGVSSIGVQAFADLYLGPVIKGDSFYPRARVDSQLVELTFYDEPKFSLDEDEIIMLRRCVEAAFFKRRKKIVNSLAVSNAFPNTNLRDVLQRAGIDPDSRAETIPPAKFALLAKILIDQRSNGEKENTRDNKEEA